LLVARCPPYASTAISDGQIAKKVGVSRNAVTKWENSANPAIKPAHLFAVAEMLGVRPRWLACAEGPREPDLPDPATKLAEDWATLPPAYQAAVRKHVDDLLSVLASLPELRNHVPDERVAKYLKPAPPRGLLAGESPPSAPYSPNQSVPKGTLDPPPGQKRAARKKA
jgi:transcriptional regulator with XRE-family HTH domain